MRVASGYQRQPRGGKEKQKAGQPAAELGANQSAVARQEPKSRPTSPLWTPPTRSRQRYRAGQRAIGSPPDPDALAAARIRTKLFARDATSKDR